MDDIVLGLVALVAGAVFCFNGYRAFRVVIPIWGAFVGFGAGAGLVSALTGDAVLAKPLGWVLGVVLALLFALFAYLYYAVAVILAMTSLGFLVGSALMTALGVEWTWVVTVVAVLVAVVFAAVAISSDMPRIVLVVVSAIGGATAIVGGVMLLGSTLDSEDLSRAAVTDRIDDTWYWWVAYAVLTVLGIVSQANANARDDEVRAAWARDARSQP